MTKKLDERDIFEALYAGTHISKINLSEEIYNEYIEQMRNLDLPEITPEPKFTNEWLMPAEYKNIDLLQYFYEFCSNDEERLRVEEELMLFELSGNTDLVKYLIYLTDFMKEKNILWGVGRGSSVSIFLFYLIGLHKVNSIKYKLNYADFFKVEGE